MLLLTNRRWWITVVMAEREEEWSTLGMDMKQGRLPVQ